MKHTLIFRLFVCLLAVTIVMSGCAGSGGPVAENPSVTTSTGFVCPKPVHADKVTSKELNIFVWTEYIPMDIIECFELIYGVKVNKDEYSSNEEMYAKISAGGTSYDLVQPTDYIVSLMVRNNLIQKIDKTQLKALGNFDPNYLNFDFDPGNEYTLPYQAGTDAIIYNSDKVSTAPTSWNDLWDPAYAGRMVFLDDSRVVIGITLLSLGYDVNSTDPAQLEEAKVKLTDLVKNIKLFDSDSPKTALIAGDVDLGNTWTGEAVLAQRENSSILYVYPTEGAIIWQDNWAIPTGAPHIDAVYAWLNYSNQGDLFYLMLKEFPYTNPNKAALDYAKSEDPELYKQYMDSPITNTPKEAIENGHRIEDVGEATTLYDQIWTEVKGGN